MISLLKNYLNNYSYIIIMALSAAVTIFKLILFANYVEIESFNAYVIPLGVGSFLAFILSLGLVESTTKIFSRLHQSKNDLITLASYRYIFPILIKRSLILFLLLSFYGVVLNNKPVLWGLVISGVAISMVASTLLASMQRSSMKTNLMARTALFRASLSILVIFIGYKISPNYGPIIGDIIAQLLSIILGFYFLIKSHNVKFREIVSMPKVNILERVKEKDSLKLSLFLAYMIMSIPFYLDRFYFEMKYPISEMAPYSLCAILLGASYLIFNTLYQRMGPLMIIEYKSGMPLNKVMSIANKTAIAGIGCLLIIFGMVILAYNHGLAENLFSKYQVSLRMLYIVFFISIFNCTSIFEGVFLSFDQEQNFMYCSLFYFIFLSLIIATNSIFTLSLLSFLEIYLFLKISHTILITGLLYWYVKIDNKVHT